MITLVSLVLSEAKSPLSLSSFSFLCIKWPEQCVRVAACSIFTVKWNTCQGSNFSAIYTRTNCAPLPLCHLPLQHERRVRRLSLSALVNFAHLKRGTSRWLYQTDPWSWPFPPSTASLNTWVVHVCVSVCGATTLSIWRGTFRLWLQFFSSSLPHFPTLPLSISCCSNWLAGLTIRSRVDLTITPEPDAPRNFSCCCCWNFDFFAEKWKTFHQNFLSFNKASYIFSLSLLKFLSLKKNWKMKRNYQYLSAYLLFVISVAYFGYLHLSLSLLHLALKFFHVMEILIS